MGKVLAIGDIHTKIWIVEKVSKVINNYDRIIFCGDYADDFSASPQDTLKTWKSLRDLQIKYKNKVSLVLGNHDYIYVYDTPSIQTGYNQITHTLINAPENKNLKDWLASLPIIIEIDGVAYSHAGIANEWSGAPMTLTVYGMTLALFGFDLAALLHTRVCLKYLGIPLPIPVMKSGMRCGA